jgi:hypothetical protein
VVLSVAITWVSTPGLFARAESPGERTLLIVLDAVPYQTVVRLKAADPEGEGLFAEFAPPVPLISTFPSSTSIALAGILGDLGLGLSPGYEPRFFDWSARRRRGGGLVSYFKISFPWREFFDWNRKGPVRNALHATRPVRAGIQELERALAAFEASDRETFTIYIADTDTAAHLFGPVGLDPILRALDADLRALRRRSKVALRIVLLSDHGLAGGEPLRNVLPGVRRRIEDRGWRLRKQLQGSSDVVLTPYGLVSSFEAYAAPELVASLAGALAGVEGVDLCVAGADGDWWVTAAEYSLQFARRTSPRGLEWSWRLHGEPGGGLAGELAAIAADGEWVSDRRLLDGTLAARYPDPLYRLAAAFEAVENPASIICSVADGYMYGAQATERSARWTKGPLRWTHGALHRQASLGFLMTDRASSAQPVALRYDRALARSPGELVRVTPR